MNPIWQNKGHIKSLKEWLGPEFELVPYYSILVFFESATFKTGMNFKDADVIYVRNLIKTIEQYQTTATSKETAEKISGKLNKLLIGNKNKKKEIVKQHVQNINNAKGKQKANIDNSKCPKCGGKLQVKNGKFGKFVGCSNYPKCRYTRKEFINPGSIKIQKSSST
ncbi:topoisomerase DNA-binding C4 zinc finger domain-containing protein [Caldifermentibacillus hisashii]|uniref:Topoisomerase DNA-binding C4 zinc finger domain-containing protein n=1 Tax=Caldifermentibacillus hisashii TaxID=996558 RepID=A0ABU9K0G2_9BACI|nr:topoisomerase DNA-binding C4 zinc finger domain-containing protein [Caldibacillus thermoamylovorans]MCM3055711.1 topoisomerase DNA-binding C4 zinc finger domain-containing protein [Caldibacillus thermoamylovorans]